MTDSTIRRFAMTIGIDLCDRYSRFAVLDAAGELVKESRLRSTPAAFQQRFARCRGSSPGMLATE